MKKRIKKILFATILFYFTIPAIDTYSQEENFAYAGITKEIDKELDIIFNRAYQNSWQKVYTTANVNIRANPEESAEILRVIPFNQMLEIYDKGGDWAIVKISDIGVLFAYVNKWYITDESCHCEEYDLPENTGFKSFMPHVAIIDDSSLQYALQTCYAYTGKYGIRQVYDRYCIAIGTALNVKVGTYVDLILENGSIIPCIVADLKSPKDTLPDNITTAQNGCVSEFIVDISSLCSAVKRDGDISSCCEEWNSPTKKIKIFDKNIFN